MKTKESCIFKLNIFFKVFTSMEWKSLNIILTKIELTSFGAKHVQ